MPKLTHSVLVLLVLAHAPSVLADDHVVRRGETLGGIARKYRCTLVELKAANGIHGDGVQAGRKLTIPETCGPHAGAAAEPTGAPRKAHTITHQVLADETLESIAERYATTPEAILAKNKATLKRGVKPGQRLKIVTTADERVQKRTTYVIQSGDTLGRIARRFGLTVRDLQRMNPGKDPDRLQIGQKLVIYGEGKSPSEAVGRPQAGRLVNGEQLTDGPGYFVRRPPTSWATNETIRALKAAFADLKKKHPSAHDICVGDLSRKEGGFLSPHKSHQSGLDADIGFVFKGQPRAGPKVFLNANAGIDLEGTWKLINALAGPSEAASRIDYMFIDYGVQKRLYDWAKLNGATEAKLAWLFQYPRGNRAMRGLIRHEPKHDNHIHVRFVCPAGDDKCG